MSDLVIPPPYTWLFLGAVHWQVTLATITALAIAGALQNQHRARLLCFGMALLLSADVLLLFILPSPD